MKKKSKRKVRYFVLGTVEQLNLICGINITSSRVPVFLCPDNVLRTEYPVPFKSKRDALNLVFDLDAALLDVSASRGLISISQFCIVEKLV